MTEKYIVGCDLDDVVLDFSNGLRHSISVEYGIEVPEFTSWNYKEVLDPILGRSWWKWMRERDWLWPNFPAVPGAIGGLTKLRNAGFYVECVTSKPEWAEFSVWKWMGKWRPPFNRVTIVDMDTPKHEATDADVLIDDKPQNVNDYARAGGKGILFNTSSNQEAPLIDGVYRGVGWNHVVELVNMDSRGEL